MTESLFLEALENTLTPVRIPLYQWSVRRTDRYLNNTEKTQETIIHNISGIRTCDFRNQEVANFAFYAMTTGIGRDIFI